MSEARLRLTVAGGDGNYMASGRDHPSPPEAARPVTSEEQPKRYKRDLFWRLRRRCSPDALTHSFLKAFLVSLLTLMASLLFWYYRLSVLSYLGLMAFSIASGLLTRLIFRIIITWLDNTLFDVLAYHRIATDATGYNRLAVSFAHYNWVDPTHPRLGPRRIHRWEIVQSYINQLWYPAPRPGFDRIWWRSALGKHLYFDIKLSDIAGVELVHLIGTTSLERQRSLSNGNALSDLPGTAQQTRVVQFTNAPSPNVTRYNTPSSQSTTNSTSTPQGMSGNSVHSRIQTHGQIPQIWLILCVTTRKSRKLQQIDMTNVRYDHDVFKEIKKGYNTVIEGEDWFSRPAITFGRVSNCVASLPSWIGWMPSIVVWCFKVRLFKPENIRIVEFKSMPLPQGIAPFPSGKQSFPPEDYVLIEKTWHYYPCPVGGELDMHSSFVTQMLEPKHAFSRQSAWRDLFPKKLNSKYQQRSYDNSDNRAWCIHIIEGLNIAGLVWLCLLVFLLSGLVGVVYSVVTGDPGAAWTVAGWFGTTIALSILCLQQSAKGILREVS
ncbi:hypothetical protein F5Y10DRAFT_161519 [Nemania abortiva]|nr:hypothetical protein F5Y10DRAFT_161519 [Nemania abortiva]